MHLADELEHLVARVAVQHMVEQVPDKELHRSPFLRRDRRPVRRVALVVRIVEHGGLSLVEVHRGALALIHVDDLAHPLRGALAPEQEATAPFQKGAEVVNVGTGKVVEEDFEDEKGDVDGRDAELGQFGEEAQVLCAGCRVRERGQINFCSSVRSGPSCKLTLDRLSARSAFRFRCKYRNSSSSWCARHSNSGQHVSPRVEQSMPVRRAE